MKNNLQTLENIQASILAFLENWRLQGKNQQQLVNYLKEHCIRHHIKNLPISTSTLSKIKNKSVEVSEKTYFNLAKVLQNIDKDMPSEIPISSQENPFKHLVGKYEIYHQARHPQTLIKNILEITQEGKAFIYTASQHTHYGEVNVFQGTMVAITFHQLDRKEFYYQLLMNLKGYLEYGLAKVSHLWAISTTVSLEQFPMANVRILCPIENSNNKVSPETIDLNSPHFKEYLERCPALSVFTSQTPTRLLCPYEVNEVVED